MDMLIGSTAEFYWLNYEEIHIVGCPMYMDVHGKLHKNHHQGMQCLSNFSLFLPVLPGLACYCVSEGSL